MKMDSNQNDWSFEQEGKRRLLSDQASNAVGFLKPQGAGPQQAGPQQIDQPPTVAISYWRLAWGQKLFLLCFGILGLICSILYVILTAPLYKATATVEIVGFNQSFMGMSQVDPQAGTDTTSVSASNIQTQTRILMSRNLLSRTAERMNMEMTPVTFMPVTIFTRLRNRIPYMQTEPLLQSREAVSEAVGSLVARGVGATRLIEIQCSSTSPEVAANFVNTLASEHVSQTLAARANLTQRTSQWMESQLEEAKARLQQSGEKLREFVQKPGMDFFPEQNTLADTTLKQLQGDVSASQADRIAKQSRWELARATPAENLPDVLADPNLQNLKGKISDLRREMAQLTATLTPEHYKVRRVQAQITELQADLEKEKAGALRHIKNDFDEALRREKLLLGAYGGQTRTVSSQSDKASQYSMLKRDVELQQQLYSALLQQSNQAALIALAPASSIRVVDPAVPTSIPSSPKPVRDIPLGAFGGFGLGYGLLLLRETFRRKKFEQLFQEPGHMRLLGIPELGVIPSAIGDAPKKRIGPSVPAGSLILRRNASGLELTVRNKRGAHAAEVVALKTSQTSLLSESFRQTLVSVIRTKPVGHNPMYVVTSAGPGEGKTTLCANLAIAMADIGQRVLLIDADLRRAKLHELFGLKDEKGLSDLLVGEEPLEKVDWDELLQPTKAANLHVLTRGLAEVETPGALFFSSRVEQLVAILQEKFDYILVDTGPVMLFPDARLWGKHSDGIVLVVRARVTAKEDAMYVCQRFLDDGIQVLGTILNDWTPKEGAAYGPYAYGYSDHSKR